MQESNLGASIRSDEGRTSLLIIKALSIAIEHLESQDPRPESDIEEMKALLDGKFPMPSEMREALAEAKELNSKR